MKRNVKKKKKYVKADEHKPIVRKTARSIVSADDERGCLLEMKTRNNEYHEDEWKFRPVHDCVNLWFIFFKFSPLTSFALPLRDIHAGYRTRIKKDEKY